MWRGLEIWLEQNAGQVFQNLGSLSNMYRQQSFCCIWKRNCFPYRYPPERFSRRGIFRARKSMETTRRSLTELLVAKHAREKTFYYSWNIQSELYWQAQKYSQYSVGFANTNVVILYPLAVFLHPLVDFCATRRRHQIAPRGHSRCSWPRSADKPGSKWDTI